MGIVVLILLVAFGIIGFAFRCFADMIKVAVVVIFGVWALALVTSCSPDRPPEPIRDVETQHVPLPVKCQEFYNDGTDAWKDCMGVGLK